MHTNDAKSREVAVKFKTDKRAVKLLRDECTPWTLESVKLLLSACIPSYTEQLGVSDDQLPQDTTDLMFNKTVSSQDNIVYGVNVTVEPGQHVDEQVYHKLQSIQSALTNEKELSAELNI